MKFASSLPKWNFTIFMEFSFVSEGMYNCVNYFLILYYLVIHDLLDVLVIWEFWISIQYAKRKDFILRIKKEKAGPGFLLYVLNISIY